MIFRKLKSTLQDEGFLGLVDVLLSVALPFMLLPLSAWYFYGKVTFAVYFSGAMWFYYLLSCAKRFGFKDPSLCAVFPVWFFRFWTHYSQHGFSARLLVTALCAIAVMWQWLVALFSGTVLHGAFADGIDTMESVYYIGSWWLGMNAYAYLATRILTERTRWYQRLYDYWFPTNYSEKLTVALKRVFKWTDDQFKVSRISNDKYLIDTDGVPVSNKDIYERLQRIENASKLFIISIDPIDGRVGDFIIHIGEYMIDERGRSTATIDDLHWPDESEDGWIFKVPMLNLGYAGGGWCQDLERNGHGIFFGPQGFGKTHALRRFVWNYLEQFPNTYPIVFSKKGIDWYNCQWDMRPYFHLSRPDMAEARNGAPMLGNFSLLRTDREFKNLYTFLIDDQAKRDRVFESHGCTSWAEYVEEVGYWNCKIPSILVILDDLKSIVGDRKLASIYNEMSAFGELMRAYRVLFIVGSQAAQQEKVGQIRDSMKKYTFGATSNQNDYLLDAEFEGEKLIGVCSLTLYNRSNSPVRGFIPACSDIDLSVKLAESQEVASKGKAWKWMQSIRPQLESEGRQVTVRLNQEHYV